MKQGAMFGLDARIALAIFGALSVISGAALYSAIQDSKVIAIITELQEVAKAHEQYYLDTGELLSVKTGHFLDVNELISSTKNGWEGPYLPYGMSDPVNGYTLTNTNFPETYLNIMQYNDAAFGNSTNATPCGTPCYSFLRLGKVPVEIADAIDAKVDGENDRLNGKVRVYVESTDPTKKIVFYKSLKLN